MKTSKIILFSYIGLLATAFLVFVIVLRAADKTYREGDGKFISIEKDLPPFKYIYVDNGVFLSLLNDNRTIITVSAVEKFNVSEINFNVSNDTLFIHQTKNTNGTGLHLKESSSINLINNNSRIYVNGLIADTLNYLAMANSEISGFSASNIGYVNASISDSRFYAYQGSIGQLNLKTEKGNVNIRSKMNAANIQITENSDVRLGDVDKIDLEKDETSRFFCNP